MMLRFLVLASAFTLFCTSTFPDTDANPSTPPVQAELISDLDARLLNTGGNVYARVTVDWRGAACVLRSGSLIEAHVLSVVAVNKNTRVSEVDLAFNRAQCDGAAMGAFKLQLAAMTAPPNDSGLGVLSNTVPLSTPEPGGKAQPKTRQHDADLNTQLDTPVRRLPITPNFRIGSVSGIKGLKLSVGTGPEHSSVLTSKGFDVTLERHTQLLLIPSQTAYSFKAPHPGATQPALSGPPGESGPAVSGPAASESGSAEQDQPTPAEEGDLCAPSQCSSPALPSDNPGDAVNVAAAISIRDLGYSSRPQRVLTNFDHDEALAYLGPGELLVAFNPHVLVPRHSLGRSGVTARVIRAALVDTQTHQVTRTVDWELPDRREYLWPLTAGRVLVHVGSELRVYGRGLSTQKQIPLDGPLAFVRVTPDGKFIAIGVIRESHTPELHALLSQSLNDDPDEEVNVFVLNQNFETIARSTARSGLMAPTLVNEGQATLLALPNMRYRVSMQTWDNHSWTLAQVGSSCTPELSSFAPDLILLVSCNRQTEAREYRVLRPNGKTALKGSSTLNEIGHVAGGSANRDAFVMKIVECVLPVPSGATFSAADLSYEEFDVYRATDGKRLLDVHVSSPSTSRDGYALAPDGSQLAVLTRDEIAFYPVHEK
jgi:hypothetical protein